MEEPKKKSTRLKTKRREHLPKNPFEHIALALSGGGFRASSFHLGVITYLSAQKYNNVSLLERIRILSTISAGTFVGAKYAATIKQGGTIQDCYKSLYAFMAKDDLVEEALQYLEKLKQYVNVWSRAGNLKMQKCQ